MSITRIRIGKDVKLNWHVTTNGDSLPLEGRDIRLFLRDPQGMEEELPIAVSGDMVSAFFYGMNQTVTGKYKVILWENYGKIGQTVVDQDAFILVDETAKES